MRIMQEDRANSSQGIRSAAKGASKCIGVRKSLSSAMMATFDCKVHLEEDAGERNVEICVGDGVMSECVEKLRTKGGSAARRQ
jgi:hypothetical protein